MVNMMTTDERLQWWNDHPGTDVVDRSIPAVVCSPLGVSSLLQPKELVVLSAHLLRKEARESTDDYELEDGDYDSYIEMEPLTVGPWDSCEDLVQ
ncbi:MAG: hypothetical protein ACKPKO_24225 [Candidatus Fonsibacter sp.]